ncbi:MAG: SusD/RagB family nutrient-binding outer membrane lipoprotein [Mangrovibacterium sp.]
MEVGTKQLAQLFSNAEFRSCNWLTTDNYSRMSSTMANHLCGYTVCASTNGIMEQNFMNTGWHNTGFSRHYNTCIPVLQSILEITKDNNIPAYSIALIFKVYVMHQLTDLWGPVPYTKAGSGEEKVPYESQKDVYYLMFKDLNDAISSLTAAVQKEPGLSVFGAGDMIYNGDASRWIRFGNTLRLRLAMRISNIDPDKAKQEAEAAAAGATLETNNDDALCDVTSWASTGNGLPRMESFFQDIMSSTMESFMVGYNDPRLSEYWSPVVYDATMDAAGYLAEFKNNVGGYHGMTRGYETQWNPYTRAHSKYGPRFKDGNQLITPINMMHAAEAYFLKAEGAWRGWNMGGNAQSFYEKGIEISIKQWKGTSFPATEISNYINSTATPADPGNYPYYDSPTTNIPVKFSSDRDKQYEQIITQKWLALFPISIEAFADYRRTRLPKLHAKKYSVNANVNPALGQIVTRLPFVSSEITTQPDEVEKAVELLGGPDLESTPLWWDVNPN